MKKYVFYNSDINGYEEYDIRGKEYEMLMHTCCQYSSVLYLKCTAPNLKALDQLRKFEIAKPESVPDEGMKYGPYCEKHYYKVCPELCNVLLEIAEGIFEWLNGWGFKNPDDPIFYRSDGTIFFTSEIHEGACAITPRDDEDVEELLHAVVWCTGEDIRRWPSI